MCRIDKDGNDGMWILVDGLPDQIDVTFMKGAHCRDKPHCRRRGKRLSPLTVGRDGVEYGDGGRTSRSRSLRGCFDLFSRRCSSGGGGGG